MLYTNDAGIVPKTVEDLAKKINVTVTVLAAEGLTFSKRKADTMLRPTPNQHSGPHSSSSKQQARRIDRQRICYIWGVLSTQSPTLRQLPSDRPNSHGHATNGGCGSCTIGRMPRSL